MTDLERAILHIKTRADAWAVKEVEKALSQEPCESIHGSTYGGVSWGGIYKPQEPCDDAISRDAVIEAITKHMDGEDKNCKLQLSSVAEWIRGLPSVNPQYKECRTLDEFIEDSKESEDKE